MVPEEGPLDVPSSALGMSRGEVVGGGERSPVRWEAPGGAAGKTAAVSSQEPSVQHHLYRCFFFRHPVELGKPEPLVFLPQHLWETSSSSFLQLQSTALSPSDAHQSPLWLAVSLSVKSEKHFQQFLGSAVLLIAVGHMTLMLLADTRPLGSQLILEDP